MSHPTSGTAIRTPTLTSSGRSSVTWAADALAVVGAALILASAAIHLHLWATGYKHIGTIGPLFLLQGIASIPLALLLVVVRRWLVMLAGAGAMLATALGLLITTWSGLFGYQESLAVPWAGTSLVVEFGGGGVLLVAAVLALAGRRPAR